MYNSPHGLSFQTRPLLTMKTANNAHSMDVPITFLFHAVRHWRRAIGARR